MKIELTPSQLSHARVIAEKAARIMEPIPPCGFKDGTSPGGWWIYDWLESGKWVALRRLDGTNPDEDAKACARMKERLIEWKSFLQVIYLPAQPEPGIMADPKNGDAWHVDYSARFGACVSAPLEVLAVAQALIAVDEERRKSSPGSVGDQPKTQESGMKQDGNK